MRIVGSNNYPYSSEIESGLLIAGGGVLFFCGDQPSGEYLLTIGQATGGRVAIWAYDYSQVSIARSLQNGIDIETSDVAAFTASGNHLAGSLQSLGSIGQDFYGDGFDNVT